MNELWNFKDTTMVASQYWIWLLIAFAVGLWIGWVSCGRKAKPGA